MKISLITACYNAEKTVEETIRSVVSQTYGTAATCGIEFVVVDGASTDKTLEIVNSYRKKHTHISWKIISEKDTGVYNAMNKGISASTGQLLFFLNADDIFINECVLENFAAHAQHSRSGLILGDILLLNRYTGEFYYEKQDFIDKIQLLKSTVFHPATFFKREVFDNYGFYNEDLKIAADYEWYVKYFLNGGNYSYLGMPVSIFSLGGISSDEKHNRVHKDERKLIQEKYFLKNELNIVNFLVKYFPRRINKIKFRKLLAKINLNKCFN